MEHNNFTAKDLCAIIRECAKGRVSRLRLGGVELEFGGGVGNAPNNGLPSISPWLGLKSSVDVPIPPMSQSTVDQTQEDVDKMSLMSAEEKAQMEELIYQDLMEHQPSAFEDFQIAQALAAKPLEETNEDYR